jgi:hypothetical protein
MKALLAMAAAALTLALVSCQQAYQDTSAQKTVTGTPQAVLSAPSVSAGSSVIPTYTTTSVVTTEANSTNAAGMAGWVADMVANSYTQSYSANVSPLSANGLKRAPYRGGVTVGATAPSPPSGYFYSTAYTSNAAAPDTGTVYDPSGLNSGTYSAVQITYIEESNDFYAATTGLAKLYKRAYHGFASDNEVDTLGPYTWADTNGHDVVMQGTRYMHWRNEYYTDEYVSADAQSNWSTDSGRYEVAAGLTLAAVWDTNVVDNATKQDIVAQGKFTVSVVASSPYTTTSNGSYSGNDATIWITVVVYDSHNKEVYRLTNAASLTYGSLG